MEKANLYYVIMVAGHLISLDDIDLPKMKKKKKNTDLITKYYYYILNIPDTFAAN